jgi:prephenate dehydrogenase
MRIAILGCGRMGSWLARCLHHDHSVAVNDLDRAKLNDVAGTDSGLTQWSDSAELADFAPEIFINCLPLGKTVEGFVQYQAALPDNCLLADIASVKTGLADFYQSCSRPFVSTHPMFGPTHASEQDLLGQTAVLIRESDESGKLFFLKLYSHLGIRVFEEDFEGHDRTVAYSLSTPFTSTLVFAACMKRLDAPGTNFRKHMDIARGLLAEDDTLLAEILFNPHTVRQLELINSQLAYLTHIIKDRDREEMDRYINKLRANIGL